MKSHSRIIWPLLFCVGLSVAYGFASQTPIPRTITLTNVRDLTISNMPTLPQVTIQIADCAYMDLGQQGANEWMLYTVNNHGFDLSSGPDASKNLAAAKAVFGL